jgi:hypothetical protein
VATQQSFLAKLGARLSTLGSAGSVALAFPLSEGAELMSAHTDATRTGWYATMSAGAQSIHSVVGGQDGFSLTRSGSNVNGAFQGSVAVAPLPASGVLPPILRVADPGNFALAASTEWNAVYFNLSGTSQFATGPLVEQSAFRIEAPSYAFVGASTITTASTMTISGAPTAGTNATFTHGYALWIQGGAIHLGPVVPVDYGALLEAVYDTPTKNNGINATMFSNSFNVNFGGRRARGTLGAPAAVQTADVLSSYGAVGYGSTGFGTTGRAKVQLVAGETWTDTAQGAYITFFTTATGGTSTVECARFSATGTLRLGVPNSKTGQISFANSGTAFNVILQADTTTPSNYTLTLPPAQGAASSVLSNDGTGILSWATTAPAALTATYVGFGSAGNLLTGSSKLTWNDTTGTLSVVQGNHALLDPGLFISSVWTTVGVTHRAIHVNLVDLQGSQNDQLSSLVDLQVGASSRFTVYKNGEVLINRYAANWSAAAPNPAYGFHYVEAAENNMGAGTEYISARWNLNATLQWDTGALGTQRSFVVTAPTYSFVGASVITTAATFAVTAAPIAGTFATITNSYAAWIQSGLLALGTSSSAVGQMVFLNASNANTLTIQSGVTSASYALTLPAAVGALDQVLVTDASGVLSWGTRLTGTFVSGNIPFANGTNSLTDASASGSSVFTYSITNGVHHQPSAAANNEAFGTLAGNSTMTGVSNALFGYNAGKAITSGSENAFFGALAGFAIQGGNFNTAVGKNALVAAISTQYNTAIGWKALPLATGDGNTAIGADAGPLTTTGSQNVFIGVDAGDSTAANASNRLVIGSGSYPITQVFIGRGEAYSSGAAITYNATGGSGTDKNGGAFNIAGGRGTGTGVGGDINLQTAKASTTGSTPNTLVTRLSVLQDGAADWTGIATASAPAVSAVNHGAIFYDSTLQSFQVSMNGGAWSALTGTAALTATYVGFGSAGNLLTGSSFMTFDSTVGALTLSTPGLTASNPSLNIFQTWNSAGVGFNALLMDISTGSSSQNSTLLELRTNGGPRFSIGKYGTVTVAPFLTSGLTPAPSLTITAPANSTNTLSTEANDVYVNLARTVNWTVGALTTQRAFYITAPTYSFSNTSTLTTAATFAISGAPAAGTNATITNTYAAWIQSGLLALGTQSSAVGQMVFNNASNANTLTIQSGVTSGSYTLTLPLAQGAASSVLSNDGSGVLSWATTAPASLTSTQIGFGSAGNLLTGSTKFTWNDTNGSLAIAPAAQNGVTPTPMITTTGAANTANIASVESNDIYFNLARTVQWATGALTTQRAVYVTAPTYAFVGASTITNAATFAISGAPAAGTNATLTNRYALWVQAGRTQLSGGLNVTGATTNSITQLAASGGSPTFLTITGAAQTGLDASTEINGINFNFAQTYQFNTGAIADLRTIRIQSPTYSFIGASTVTDADTVSIGGPPTGGTNATLTEVCCLSLETRALTNVTNAYGLKCAAPTGATKNYAASFTGAIDMSPIAQTGAPPPGFKLTLAAHTALTASTEFNAFWLAGNGVTQQFATGALTTQRAYRLSAPTYSFVGASVITTAATLAIDAAPVAGTNATITNALAFWVQAGATSIQGLGTGTATANVSTVLDKSNFYFTFTGSTAAQTVTLPAANIYGAGRTPMLVIRNKSSVVVAVSRAGADTIDGGTTINLPAGSSVFLFSNGVSAWDSN